MVTRLKGWSVCLGIMIMCIALCLITAKMIPCEECGDKPTKKFENQYSGENEYYCKACYTDCAWCSGKADRYYINLIGEIMFVCEECDD